MELPSYEGPTPFSAFGELLDTVGFESNTIDKHDADRTSPATEEYPPTPPESPVEIGNDMRPPRPPL